MHPYGPAGGYHPGYWYRGPRRIIWFFFGAAAATWWIKRKECYGTSYGPGHCLRAPVQRPTFTPNESSSWSPRDIPKVINNIPITNSDDQAHGTENEHMLALSQKAGDKMVEISEATLDTVLTTVEILKAKLAEHRAEREKQKERKQETTQRLV